MNPASNTLTTYYQPHLLRLFIGYQQNHISFAEGCEWKYAVMSSPLFLGYSPRILKINTLRKPTDFNFMADLLKFQLMKLNLCLFVFLNLKIYTSLSRFKKHLIHAYS